MRDIPVQIDPDSPKLLDQLRISIRSHNLAFTTEKTYVSWVVRFIRFHKLKHPKDMGKTEVEHYLNYLAVVRNCSASTQRSALNALVFLYKKFLKIELPQLDFDYSKKPKRMPVVLTSDEAISVLNLLSGKYWLGAAIIYGSGLRISEVVKLRIKDIDFSRKQIIVRNGKGDKDRVTLLPDMCKDALMRQIELAKVIHSNDLASGCGQVSLPDTISRMYPNTFREVIWQYVFPSIHLANEPGSGIRIRHHLDETVLRKKIKKAIRQSGVDKRASSHSFRHSFATELLTSGVNIRVVQQLLGHSDVRTTEIYTHVTKLRSDEVTSPLDVLS